MTQQIIQSGLPSNAVVIIDLTEKEKEDTKNEKKCFCEFCGKTFRKKRDFVTHINYHIKKKTFSSVRSIRPEGIIIDLTEEEEDKKIYLCQFCDKKFKKKKKFLKHKNFHKLKQCQYCSKIFNIKRLKDHEKIHNIIKDRHRCNFCDQTFNQKVMQKRHKKTCHPNLRQSKLATKIKLELET